MAADPLAPKPRKGTENRGFRCPGETWDPAKAVAASRGENLTWLLVGALTAYASDPARVVAMLGLAETAPAPGGATIAHSPGSGT